MPATTTPDIVVALLRDGALSIGDHQLSEQYSSTFFEPKSDAQSVLDRVRALIPIASLGVGAPERTVDPSNDIASKTITEVYRDSGQNTVLELKVEQLKTGALQTKPGVAYSVDFSGPAGVGTLVPSAPDWAWRDALPVPPKGARFAEASLQLSRWDTKRRVLTVVRYEDVRAPGTYAKAVSLRTRWKRGARFVSKRPGLTGGTVIAFNYARRAGTMTIDPGVQMLTTEVELRHG